MVNSADRRLLSAASLLFVGFCVVGLLVAVSTGSMLDITSGVWLSLAVDLSQGVFYRPLVGDAGVGGTRYFPLTFLVHGFLIRLGLSPIAAGHAVELCSAAALIWAALRVLEELSVPRAWARALAPLTLCSTPAMFALTTIRGDLLPAALNLWGVAFALRTLKHDRIQDVGKTIAFFSIAALAKPTAVYAALAIAGAFVLIGRLGRATMVAAGTLVAVVVLLGTANVASNGRMMESFRACAMVGVEWGTVRRAPLSAMSALVRQDPISTLLLTLAAVSLLNLRRDEWKEPLTCLIVACLAMVVFLYSSPGVDFNHLIDFFVVATLFVGGQMARRPVFRATGAKAIAVGAMVSLVVFYLDIRHSMLSPEVVGRASAARFVRDLPRHSPIFADNGIVPSSLGERNFILDGFMLQALRHNGLEFETVVNQALDARRFGAIVLMTSDPNRLANLYGANFPASLTANYELATKFSSFVIYRPKGS